MVLRQKHKRMGSSTRSFRTTRHRTSTLSLIVGLALFLSSPGITFAASTPLPTENEISNRAPGREPYASQGGPERSSGLKIEGDHRTPRYRDPDDPPPGLEITSPYSHTDQPTSFLSIIQDIIGPSMPVLGIPRNSTMETVLMPPDHPVFTLTWVKRDVPEGYTELVRTYTAGYVVLSYFIAVIGSVCTLELLLRRTSNRGWSNVTLLVCAGICFGSVSTFSMHFIGNNSLSLSRPPIPGRTLPTYTLSYAAGWTILSLAVSCSAMILAFAVMGLDINWRSRLRSLGRGESGEDAETRSKQQDSMNGESEDGSESTKGVKKDDAVKMKDLARRTKIDSVMEKLEWALSWSMVDLPAGLGGSAKGRKRLAEEKARKKRDEIERPGLNERKLSWRQGEETTQEAQLDAQRKWSPMQEEDSENRRSGEEEEIDITFPSNRPPRKTSGREAEEGTVGVLPDLGLPPRRHVPMMLPTLPSPTLPSTTFPGQLSVPTPWMEGQSLFPHQSVESGLNSAATFTPGFSFPAFPSSSTTALLPASESAPTTPVTARTQYPPTASPLFSKPTAVHQSPWAANVLANRRASLPLGAFTGKEYVPPTYNLARIQSSTDQDQETDHPDYIALQKVQADEERKSKAEKAQMVEKALRDARAKSSADNPVFDITATPIMGDSSSNFAPQQEAVVDVPKSVKKKNKTRERIYKWLGLDIVTRAEVIKILVTGCIAGGGVAGMHYIGQRSIISIPYIAYNVGSIFAAIIIACIAVSAALYILFIILRPKLKHDWYVKLGVAFFLAAAVCAMHYTGMAGTTYGLLATEPAPASARVDAATKTAITGTVAALACAACLGIIAFLVTAHLRTISHRKGRRRVVIATMVYDQDNRLLVGTDGVLPMSDIASVQDKPINRRLSRQKSKKTWDSESSSSSVLDVDLTTGHPAFIAALRSTWAWRQTGTTPVMPMSPVRDSADLSIKPSKATSMLSVELSEQNYSTDAFAQTRRGSALSTAESAAYPQMIGHQAPMPQNVSKFLERFSLAVSVLATHVTGSSTAVRRLGVLYDRILTTGHVVINSNEKHSDAKEKVTVSKGQLVFLVRKLDSVAERNQLLARGFMFAEPMAVAAVMSKVLAVPVDNISEIIRDQVLFCERGMTSGVKSGRLYAGIFMIQPTPFDGIHIWTGQNRHSLPMREICPLAGSALSVRSQSTDKSTGLVGTADEIQDALAPLANQSLFDLIASCSMQSNETTILEDPLVTRLRSALVNTLIPMLDMSLPSQAMTKLLPRLKLRPVLVPLLPPSSPLGLLKTSAQAPETAWIIIFKAVVHADADTSTVDWENWALFRAQNACVMQEGRDIQLAARLAFANAAINVEPEFNRARRPSKIQWGTDPLVDGEPIPPSPRGDGRMTPNFFSPAFTAGYTMESEQKPSRSSSPGGTVKPAGRLAPDLTIKVPRRSSLMRQPSAGPLMAEDVASHSGNSQLSAFDKDWLLKLLQEDLYAPQEEDE